jgi:hypothetical protein
MEFILGGKRFNVEARYVEKKMNGADPETVRTHAVKVAGRLYPVKQVLADITGLSKADFNSHQAHQILRRLGLDVITVKQRGRG